MRTGRDTYLRQFYQRLPQSRRTAESRPATDAAPGMPGMSPAFTVARETTGAVGKPAADATTVLRQLPTRRTTGYGRPMASSPNHDR